MDTDRLIALGLLGLSLGLTVFGAIVEAALATTPRLARGHHDERVLRAGTQEWAGRHHEFLLATLQIIKTAGVAFACVVLAWLIYPAQGTNWANALGIGLAALALLVLLQAIPRALATRTPARAFRLISPPLRLLHFLLRPVTAFYRSLAQLAVRLIWREPARHDDQTKEDQEEEELGALVEEISEHNEELELEEEEREMIRRIIGLEHTTVREIMVPRIDIVAAEADAPVYKVIDLIVQHGFSRIPVYNETIDNIVGMVYAKDLLRATQQPGDPPLLQSLVRPAYFVPEPKHIDEMLREFRERRTHAAIVVDEYGGTAGMATLEDLLEEIVGEIEDEYDRHEAPIERVSQDEAILDARVSIADLNELFNTAVPQEDYDTVGGLVYAALGKIPSAGDEVRVDGLTISVLSTLGRRIKKVRAVHRAGLGEDGAAEG